MPFTSPLKRCPFCGCSATLSVKEDGFGHGESYDAVEAHCDKCPARIADNDYAGRNHEARIEKITIQWNTRTC